MCQYTNIHPTGEESEGFVMQEDTTSAQPHKRNAACIPIAQARGFTRRVDKVNSDRLEILSLFSPMRLCKYLLFSILFEMIMLDQNHIGRIQICRSVLINTILLS